MLSSRPGRPTLRLLALALSGLLSCAAQAAGEAGSEQNEPSGPVRLSTSNSTRDNSAATEPSSNTERNRNTELTRRKASPYIPGEFELYVNKLAGVELPQLATGETQQTLQAQMIRRLGADLMLNEPGSAAAEGPRQVPADYLLGVGDEVQLTLWGSVDADLRLTVDRSGRLVIPRVGPVMVSGIRYADLSEVIRNRVGQVFKNFQLSTSLGKLRSIRIYVTGFTAKPGAYTVSSLATLVTALSQAGGPSAAGSFRQIELRRNGRAVAEFDAYDLLLKGDKRSDRALQAEDVIHIGPVGSQVAILGSVNRATIAELKPGETLEDVLAMAGGFSAVADRSRVTIERLSERSDRRVAQVELPQQAKAPIGNGDVVRAFSGVSATLPQHRQYKRIRVEGEVARPGEYVLPPTSTLHDAIKAAGGLTPQAYVFGTDFSRESVRQSQQENYDRALRDLETEFTKNSSTQRAATADEAQALSQRAGNTSRLVERLRAVRPTGRIVLQLEPNAKEPPPLVIEEGDKLLIPARPTTVGVFGSVFNAGSFLLADGSSVDDVLKLAGGPTRGADSASLFIIRANGTVVSARQSSSGWLGFGSGVTGLRALPGDTVFVPEEMNKTTFMQEAKDWTQILYQFGLGAAALKTIKN
jgi:protein involved in polysaccharide export with SLBB domain